MSRSLRIRPGVVEWRQLEEEIVAVDTRQSTYMAVNRSGALLWPALLEERPARNWSSAWLASTASTKGMPTATSTCSSRRSKTRISWSRRHAICPTSRSPHLARGMVGVLERKAGANPTAPGRHQRRTPPSAPKLPAAAELGVSASLRLRREACLVRAAVRQQWFAAHGSPRDIVIGVRGPAHEMTAHAWLDGDSPCHSEGFEELLRRPLAH